MPRRYGRWPVRDDVVEYLEEYARRHRLRVQFETEVSRFDRADDAVSAGSEGISAPGWVLETSNGELTTRFAVLATSHDADPKLPNWPGRDSFTGELIHSATHKNPDSFRGKDVLVVSARNTGSEIAYELATAGGCRVWASMRTPPSVFPREWLGYPLNYTTVMFEPLPDGALDRMAFLTQRLIYGDLAKYGIPRAPLGVQSATKKRHVSALIDAGFVQGSRTDGWSSSPLSSASMDLRSGSPTGAACGPRS